MPQDPHATGSSADVTAVRDVSDAADYPARVGPYRIDAVLGRGGMGEVYRGFDPRLQRPVAIKRILATHQGATARARFWREARTLAALQHPGFVTIHDIGESDGALYIAMELVDGTPLAALQKAAWPAPAALTLVAAVAQALGAAHVAGVVHRDVKPSNILVTPDGTPRLIDFGLARRGSDDDVVTAAGAVVGTLSWMAPEQVAGDPVAPTTDVFALGTLLYTLLSGAHPFERESNASTVAAILVAAHTPLARRRGDLPADLVALVASCMAATPRERPADGVALARALEAIAARHGWSLDPAQVRAAVDGEVAAAIPGQSTDIAHPGAPRPRRRARATAVALAAVGTIALVIALAAGGPADGGPAAEAPADAAPDAAVAATSGPGETASGAPLTEAATPSRARDPVVEDARALLRDMRRRVVAIIPDATPALHADPGAAAVLADAIGVYLGFAPETLTALPRRELLARAPGADPAALTPGALVTAPSAPGRVDAIGVVTVTRERAALTVTLRWRLADAEGPFETLTATATAADPLAAARALAADTFALFDAADAPQQIPPLTRSLKAWQHTLNANDALHSDRWRELAAEVRDALAADPGFAPALLLGALLDIDSAQIGAATATLEAIRSRPGEVTPRDASFAGVLLGELSPAERATVVPRLEAHLARFPHDVTAQIELLGVRFRIGNAGSLQRAAEYAETILAVAPATPAAASKLVRALCWTGRCEQARERLSALGLSPDMPGMAQVFGELELYQRRYAEALALFDRSRDRSDAVTYYAAHMSLAATMLRGDCERAVADGRQMLATARDTGDTLGIDWTYFLWFNALMCAGEPASARLALDAWAERTGTTAAAESYAGYRWRVELAMGAAPAVVLDEVEAAAAAPEHRHHFEALHMLALIGTDPAALRAHAAALTKRLGVEFGPRAARPSTVDRSRRALLARADLLEGRTDEAIAAFEELARPDAWPIANEGDLFDRVRSLQTLAVALDEADRRGEAEAVWRRVLDLGYERLLVMEVTLAAKRRLGLLPPP